MHPHDTSPRICFVDGCGQKHSAKGLCRKHYSAANYAADPKKYLLASAAWNRANAEQRREIKANWNGANTERRMATDAIWRKANPEKAQGKAKKWRDSHKEQRRIAAAAWHKANPEEATARTRAWRQANPEKQRALLARRYARLGKDQRTGQKLLPGEWEAIQLTYGNRCAYCGVKGKKLTKDHVVPIAKGGLHVVSNIVPACLSCNSQKGTGLPLKPVSLVLL